MVEEKDELLEVNAEKRRGAPLGNQNARTHGFYSKVLTQEESESLESAGEVDGLDAEIALLRVKIRSIVIHDPENVEVFAKALTTLTRLLVARDGIVGRRDRGGLKQAVIDALKDIALPVGIGIGKAFKK